MLMLDRYLVAGGRALDLATGAAIRWHVRRRPAQPALPLFTMRAQSWLIDFDVRGHSRFEIWERPASGAFPAASSGDTLETFRAALADARDGRPRALDLAEPSTAAWARTHRVLAREARLAGFVPLAADALGAVLAQARWRWPSWLKDRSLVVFATDTRLSNDATLALFRLATKDARPHLIVRTATADRPVASAVDGRAAARARTKRGGFLPTPGSLIARSQQLRLAGQVTDAEATARWGVLLTTGAEQAAARCALARCLIAAAAAARSAGVAVAGRDGRSRGLAGADHPRRPRAAHRAGAGRCVSRRAAHLPGGRRRRARAVARGGARARHPVGDVRGVRVAASRRAARDQRTRAPRRRRRRSSRSRCVSSTPAWPFPRRMRGSRSRPPGRFATARASWAPCGADGRSACRWCRTTLPGCSASRRRPWRRRCTRSSNGCARPRSPTALTADLVGDSAGMYAVRQAVARAASSPFPVLIEGESGSGKELVARAIHGGSVRRTRRFCALNCAALADDLVEAELFGHTRGAFTGAVAERLGLFEEAQGGTLFLDEVAELGTPRAGEVAAHVAGRRGATAGRVARRDGSTRASSPPPIVRWRGRSRWAAFAAISATVSTSCASPFRRCAIGSKICRRWCGIRGRCWPSAPAAGRCCRPRRSACSDRTTGPATSANCRTCWHR